MQDSAFESNHHQKNNKEFIDIRLPEFKRQSAKKRRSNKTDSIDSRASM